MKLLASLCVVGMLVAFPTYADDTPIEPDVQAEIDQTFDQMDKVLEVFKKHLPDIIDQMNRIHRELNQQPPAVEPTEQPRRIEI